MVVPWTRYVLTRTTHTTWMPQLKIHTTISPSDFCRCFLSKFFLYKDGLLSTSHVNFSMSLTTDIAVWQNTQGLCTLLHAASKCSVASWRGQTATRAFYCYQQQFRCLENGSECNLNPYSIHLQLPFILEAIPPYATWGRTMPWWKESTYHGLCTLLPCYLWNRYLYISIGLHF